MDKYPCRLQPNHLPASPTQNLPIPESTEMPEALTDHSQAGTDMPALSYSMPDTADMTGWLDSDPLLDQNIFRSHTAQQFTGKPEFFQPGPILQASQNTQHLHDMLSRGLSMLWKLSNPLYTAAEEYAETDAAWSARMVNMVPDPDLFQAGRMHGHVTLLDAYFTLTKSLNASSKRVKAWIRHGIKLPFVGVRHKSHLRAAHYKQNLEVVKHRITKAVGADNVGTHLQGSRPSPVQFHDHKSVQTYASFVDTELVKALAKGVIAEWPFPEPPTVVNGLKVWDDKLPKLRLCINPMYINLFLKYEPLKYDRLQDLMDIIGLGDFMTTSNDKSGYWQLDMHP